MKTRFLTLVLTLLSAVGVWAYDFEVDGLYYSYDSSNEVYVTYEQYPDSWNDIPAYTSLSGEITIPSSVSYNGQIYSVTSIGGDAFQNCSALTSVTIPNSVTSIGGNAFWDCDALTSVTIPNSVTSIGDYAFKGCSILTSVTIPNSVTSIEYSAFSGCWALTNVYYNGSVADWCQIDFEDSSSNPLFMGAQFYINNQLVTDLVIPDEVTTIKSYAFYGCSSLTSVTIPNSVTSIERYAFSGCSALTSVTIPNSVTSIGVGAFYGCSALTSVTIPNSVTSIGSSAFESCSSLTSVTIPNSVTSIGDRAFRGCSALSHIRCEATTPPTLNDNVFGMTSFQLVFVPTGTATAYANAWGNNYTYIDSETEITVHVETAGQLAAAIVAQGATPARVTKLTVTGTLNEADFNIIKNNMPLLYSLDLSGISNTTLPDATFSQKRTLLSIALPNGLTEIQYDAFSGCSALTSVAIPNSVTRIGESAFFGCTSLTSVTIPNSVTSIGSFAFCDCSALTKVYYNGSVADWCQIEFSDIFSNPLSNGANFYINNQLVTDLVIPDEVITIKNYAFPGCTSLTSVTIPNSVTSIGYSAFSGCTSLTSVTIPNSMTSIGDRAFRGCSALTSVTIPNSVTSIGNRAFRGCSALTSVTIPNSVTSIGSYAFYGCSALTSVTIPNSVTSIGYGAFYGCSALTSVTIPNSVTSIGDRAFKECSALSYICSEAATPPTLDGAPFSFTNFQVVFVPAGTATAYANAWGNNYTYIDSETEVTVHVETVGQLTAAIVEQGATPAQVTKLTVTGTLNEADFNIIKNNMPLLYSLDLSGISNTTLPNAAFSQKQTLLSIAIPNGLTGIPNRTFEDCSGLASVTIPNSVTSIGHDAFYGCSALTSVTIPNSVTSIGNRAFESCSALTSVTIPNSVTSIGYGAFEECSALTSVTIPNSVTSIGNRAFESCSALTSVTIPNSVTSIGEQAFRYCFALTSVTIPNSVTSIGEQAFKSCFALTSVTIGNKVQNIYSNTFSSCYQLDTITCLGSVPPTVDSNFETIDPNTCKLYVPNNALMDYASAPVWSAFLNMEGIDVNYQLTLQINEGGKVSCNNHDYTDTTELTFAAGTEVSLKLIPDAGYRVSSVFVNGEYYTDQITEDLTFILTLKSDATISVSFKSEEYVITFVNDDGTVLQSEQLEYGEMPIYNGAVPTKEATAEYEYEFIGWSPEITIVTGDARYTATYKEVQLSAYNTATSSRLRAWQADGTLFVEVDDAVEAVMVYDVTGRLMQEYQHNGGYQMLNLPAPNKVNLVKVVSKDGSVNTHKLM